MILLLGIPSEAPLEMVEAALREERVPYRLWNQRHSLDTFILKPSTLRVRGEDVDLSSVTAVYVRLCDHLVLPEYESAARESAHHIDELHRWLISWLAATTALVVSPLWAMGSNASKPYQAQLIAQTGFATPDTLVTNAPDAVVEFIRLYEGEVVYKSVSSTRSVVRKVGPADLARLGDVLACPTQFQQRVGGVDVRVHVVGDEVFATRIESSADDYRYGSRDGEEAQLSVETLDDGIAERCRLLAAELGLPFAGIDLRIGQGEVWCLEVNPAPAFSYYQMHTGQPIARAVARLLVSGKEARRSRSS